MVLTLLALAGTQLASGHIHSAFDFTPTEAQGLFRRGFDDAEHMRDDNGVLNRFRRGIGDIRTSAIKHETVSWLWVLPPRVAAYHSGFEARKKFEPESKLRDIQSQFGKGVTNPSHHLWVTGHIRLLPSRGGLYGTLSRRANPQDLEDVRVVIRAGGHTYQPIRQPGDLLGGAGSGTNTFTTHETETNSANATITTPRGNQYTINAVSQSTYTITHEQNFKWYEGDFYIAFDLFDEDGTPRITATDNTFEVIVVYGSNERHAEFPLKDFLKI